MYSTESRLSRRVFLHAPFPLFSFLPDLQHSYCMSKSSTHSRMRLHYQNRKSNCAYFPLQYTIFLLTLLAKLASIFFYKLFCKAIANSDCAINIVKRRINVQAPLPPQILDRVKLYAVNMYLVDCTVRNS